MMLSAADFEDLFPSIFRSDRKEPSGAHRMPDMAGAVMSIAMMPAIATFGATSAGMMAYLRMMRA